MPRWSKKRKSAHFFPNLNRTPGVEEPEEGEDDPLKKLHMEEYDEENGMKKKWDVG